MRSDDEGVEFFGSRSDGDASKRDSFFHFSILTLIELRPCFLMSVFLELATMTREPRRGATAL